MTFCCTGTVVARNKECERSGILVTTIGEYFRMQKKKTPKILSVML